MADPLPPPRRADAPGPGEVPRVPWAAVTLITVLVYVADQLSKLVVIWLMDYADQRVILDGVFKFVYWGNTGAAWSMFYGNNALLIWASVIALLVLVFTAKHYEAHTLIGRSALGLIFGGILGNLTDRIRFGHVVDFIRFYLYQRGGDEVGFPAFNIADTAICTGVGLLFLLFWRQGHRKDTRGERRLPAA